MVKDLLNTSKYPNSPDDTKQLSDFTEREGLPDESYGSKIFGYFKPPQDGAYTFYLCKLLFSKYFLLCLFESGCFQRMVCYFF